LAQYGHVALALNGGVSQHAEREFHRERTGVLAVVNHCHGPELRAQEALRGRFEPRKGLFDSAERYARAALIRLSSAR
jgi:hypothetical protein